MGRIAHGVSQGTELQIIYRSKDVKRLRKKYKIGQQLLLTEAQPDGTGYIRPKQKWYTVIAKYPHHLLCKDDNGSRESFRYYDLEKLVINR